MKNLYIILNTLFLFAVVSCKHEVKNEVEADENLVEISKVQFQEENMVLGKVEKTRDKRAGGFFR